MQNQTHNSIFAHKSSHLRTQKTTKFHRNAGLLFLDLGLSIGRSAGDGGLLWLPRPTSLSAQGLPFFSPCPTRNPQSSGPTQACQNLARCCRLLSRRFFRSITRRVPFALYLNFLSFFCCFRSWVRLQLSTLGLLFFSWVIIDFCVLWCFRPCDTLFSGW